MYNPRNLIVLIVLVFTSSCHFASPPAPTDLYRLVTLNELFPNRVAGPIGKFTVAIPTDFLVLDSTLQMDDSGNYPFFTWGAPGSIINDEYRKCIFLVGYHPGLRLMDDGHFGGSTGPLTEESVQKKGIENPRMVYGYLLPSNTSEVLSATTPVMVMKGQMDGHTVYHIYIYSPENQEVLTIWIMGGEAGSSNVIGENLVRSLNFLTVETGEGN